MDAFVKLQPAQFCDQIVGGRELYKTPYSFCFGLDGKNTYPEFWQHNFARVVGFVADLAERRVDIFWSTLAAQYKADPASDPFQAAVGMYLVYQDAPVGDEESGQMGAYLHAIDSVQIMRPSEPEQASVREATAA